MRRKGFICFNFQTGEQRGFVASRLLVWRKELRLMRRIAVSPTGLIAFGLIFAAAAWAQAPQPYPDPAQQQYPPQGQYPPQQGQYPPPQSQQYPQQQTYPQQGQYPQQQYPPQGQYPPQQYPQQPANYPPQGQYPPQQPGAYPPQQAAPYPQAPPPYFPPQELDRVVSRIALYPDPLLAQVLSAATFSDQIPGAATWADQHHYLTGPALAAAIQADQLPYDPSVQSLLPFPNVLDMMASDPAWTRELGDAFLASQPAVMDAVQRMRQQAYNYGYLRTGPQVVVTPGPYITIAPVNPGFIVVPYYNPAVVFYPPRPGIVVTAAIGFRFGVAIGTAFAPWGWGVGVSRFNWGAHTVFINNAVWGRTWVNRASYVHPFPGVRRYAAAPAYRPGVGPAARAPESHELRPRSTQERKAWQNGRAREEDHHDEKR